jgi:hypothetical protein
MPDNNHPPIPPGCEYFKVVAPRMDGNHVWGFRAGSETWPVGTPQPRRGIIAAVAEVAWQKRAEMLIECNQPPHEINEAMSNASLWRKWGEADNVR